MKLAIIFLAAILLLGATAAWLFTPDRSRRALEARYGVGAHDYLQVAGLHLHLRETGPRDGPVVILLHGFGSSLQTWDGWAAALQWRFRVIRFDLPGFGLTGADPTGDYSDDRAARVLVALMDQLGVRRASLIGNSLGGKIAWQFAAAHPDRVDRLVLVSPDGFASPGFEYGKKAEIPLIMRALPYTLPRFMVRMSLAPAFGTPEALTPALLDRYRDMMLAPGVRAAMLARMGQVLLQPPEPDLHRITAPTLLVWGKRDAMIPFTNAADYLKAIPNGRLVEFPMLGHVPQEEAPAETVPPVLHFLAP